jgi:hypothetical protein
VELFWRISGRDSTAGQSLQFFFPTSWSVMPLLFSLPSFLSPSTQTPTKDNEVDLFNRRYTEPPIQNQTLSSQDAFGRR